MFLDIFFRKRRIKKTIIICLCAIGIMLVLGFALMPLYEMFFKVTGLSDDPTTTTINVKHDKSA